MAEKTKLTDREVRIIYLPPMTAASIHRIGGAPETDTAEIMDLFVKNSNLAKIKPDFRHLCFNHPQGKLSDGSDHGFERFYTEGVLLRISYIRSYVPFVPMII
jgi:hypothetical protein